jgi:hypothetical protein
VAGLPEGKVTAKPVATHTVAAPAQH